MRLEFQEGIFVNKEAGSRLTVQLEKYTLFATEYLDSSVIKHVFNLQKTDELIIQELFSGYEPLLQTESDET